MPRPPSPVSLLAFVLAATLSALPARAALNLDVTARGARPSGSTDATGAIQAAIDECHAAGGGEVLVPAGRFLIGTLELRDNVTLRLARGAVLAGSLRLSDYRNLDPFNDGLGVAVGSALIAAVGASNIGIVGEGAIDGRGREIAGIQIRGGDKDWGRRPFLLRLVRCSHVTVRGVSLLNSGAWTFHLFQCRDVAAEGLRIRSRGLPHNDGIDIDSCQEVRIAGCDIDSGDDALCLKTTSLTPCRGIDISGCRIKTGEAAIKFGTESAADFRDVRVTHCEVEDAREGGIKLFSVDGAHLENVLISDVRMNETVLPIMIRLGARLKVFRKGQPPQPIGTIRNVTIRDVTASRSAQIGVLISGIPGHPVENVTLADVDLQMPGGGSWEQGQARLEELEPAYPEVSMFGSRMPTPGLYARHVRGLSAERVRLRLVDSDLRPALVCQDGADVRFADWQADDNLDADVPVRLDSVRGARVTGFRLPPKAAVFASVLGADSRDIVLGDNLLGPETAPWIADDGAPAGAVRN